MISGVIILFFSQAKAQDLSIQTRPTPSPEIHLDTLYDSIEHSINPTPLSNVVINLTKSRHEIEEEKKEEERKKDQQRLAEENEKQEAEEKRIAEANLAKQAEQQAEKESLLKAEQKTKEEVESARKRLELDNKNKTNYSKSSAVVSKQSIVSGDYCSCVMVVKSFTGYTKPVGVARNWPKNSTVPKVGGVVITNEGSAKVGHVALIESLDDTHLYLKEGNYKHCKLTTGRKMLRTNQSILGFWNP